ncbi:hypothetical protein [Haloferula sp. BvORR071]|uniref:hypothetical protein n=1 Tax=Haloferula sp. BvORR071 TaxID=1396141 RepID=UPI00055305B3|nr:hypothetical protein [Haloferula sp. BvORR071]
MSDREKKLVLVFGLAAFFLINLFGISRFRSFRDEVKRDLETAKKSIDTAEENRAAYDGRVDELNWLSEHRPEGKDRQTVETELVGYTESQATAAQLTIKRRKIQPSVETGIFHRARVEFVVNGTETALYRWLDRLQMPEQFRAITFMRLSPDAKDDTLIDCTINVEQWFIPQTAETESPEGEAEGTPSE